MNDCNTTNAIQLAQMQYDFLFNTTGIILVGIFFIGLLIVIHKSES